MKRIRSVFFISLYVWVNPYNYSFFIRILKEWNNFNRSMWVKQNLLNCFKQVKVFFKYVSM